MSETVRVDDRGPWVMVTLNRPDSLNAFTGEMLSALRSALEAAGERPECRAVLLTGAGRGFCAGQDLSEVDLSPEAGAPDLGRTLETHYNPLIRLIRGMAKPVVCAVNGVAAGAGANLALSCDIVLAADSARFIQAFSKIGLIPDAGGSWALARLVGEARAKALAFTAEPLAASVAADWGLIWKAVADDALMAEAEALTARLADGPTVGLGLTKQAIQEATINALDVQLDREVDYQRRAGRTPDFREGVNAFLEKRVPTFTGRA
ncbi:MAG: 2-(1,2-epoxy-1,2-dihydrophenyl)acetyl-CoA isomerase [Alphaproteobacteria bacterium]|nr:2-(1,2-epoxy-1,2-dihydrophenyl)acetyl-CoA isomerase [Alphaproteobacteria bacterium]